MGRPRGSRNKPKDQPVTETTAAPAGEAANGAAGPAVLPMRDPQELAAETLRGDIRDAILREFKLMPKPWHAMNEQEQERVIWRARDIADQLVRQAVDIVASKGLPALPIQVGKFTVDGSAIKGAYECYADDESLLRIRHIAGARAMFVLASPDAYRGEEKVAEPDVVGDLAMPKERADEALLGQVGRGNGEPAPAVDPGPATDGVPADLSSTPHAETADPPFHPPTDGHYRGLDEAPAMP